MSETSPASFRENATAALSSTFGWDTFRPGQLEVLEALHEHRRALALFPTGGGKSLCYQLYSQLVGEGLTIVVSPLIALMKDQVDDMRARGVAAARMDSSLDAKELAAIRADMRAGKLRLLYVAPERFNNTRFRAMFDDIDIALFAVDEAHCISQWGHNFRPDYLKLVEYAHELGAEAILALTATATPAVVDDICGALEIPAAATVLTSAYRPNLFIDITPTPREGRVAVLAAKLKERAPGTTIVYVTLQRTAEEVAAALAAEGLPARAYHAGLRPEQRVAVQDEWMAGTDRIVVATIAFGMGIDKPDVRYIYHYDLPKSLESYVQEIGRAGRDGDDSRVELVGNREDLATLAAFSLGDTPAPEDIHRLVGHLLTKEDEFEVSPYKLSQYFDIRPLTLSTLMTYLELLGVLQQGTPRFGAYQITPAGGQHRMLGHFEGATREFYKELIGASRTGPKHIKTDVTLAANKMKRDKEEIIRGINYLEKTKLAEVKPSGVLKVYTKLEHDLDVDTITAELVRRFEAREAADLDRLQKVIEFVEVPACKTAFVLDYFGQEGAEDCGHCAYCVDKYRDFSAGVPGAATRAGDILFGDKLDKLRKLVGEQPKALGAKRKLARYLLGITSPATTAARLTRGTFFGILSGLAYQEVYGFVEDFLPGGGA